MLPLDESSHSLEGGCTRHRPCAAVNKCSAFLLTKEMLSSICAYMVSSNEPLEGTVSLTEPAAGIFFCDPRNIGPWKSVREVAQLIPAELHRGSLPAMMSIN